MRLKVYWKSNLPPSWAYLILTSFFFKCLASLGLRCYARAFSSCGKQGLLFFAVRVLLIVVASLVVEHGL